MCEGAGGGVRRVVIDRGRCGEAGSGKERLVVV